MRTILLATAALTMMVAPAAAQSFQAPEYYGTLGYTHFDLDGADLGAITGRLGGKFDPNFGAELEVSVGVRGDDVAVGATTVDVEHEYDVAAYLVGFVPVSPEFDLFARVGYGNTEIKVSGLGSSIREDGDSVNYGAGANYRFDAQNGVRGEWTRRDFRDGGEVDTYALSFIRRF